MKLDNLEYCKVFVTDTRYTLYYFLINLDQQSFIQGLK